MQTTDPLTRGAARCGLAKLSRLFRKGAHIAPFVAFSAFCDIVELGFIDSKEEEKAQAAAAHAFETVRVLRGKFFFRCAHAGLRAVQLRRL